MKAFVTGGAGFIGSHLVDLLIKKGYEVIVYDNLSTGKKENVNKKAEFKFKDINNLDKIIRMMTGCDIVFHLAAIPNIFECIKKPIETHNTNVTGTLKIIQAAKEKKIKKIVMASSCAVYGDNTAERGETDEDYNANPISPYGAHKLIMEEYSKVFSKIYDMDITCLRLFNVYGPRQNKDSEYSAVIAKFIELAKFYQQLKIYGDGEQTRDFVHVSDVANAFFKAKKLKGFNVINIGTEISTSVNDLKDILAKIFRGCYFDYVDKPNDEIEHIRADIYRAEMLLNWKPKIKIEPGIRKLCKDYKKI